MERVPVSSREVSSTTVLDLLIKPKEHSNLFFIIPYIVRWQPTEPRELSGTKLSLVGKYFHLSVGPKNMFSKTQKKMTFSILDVYPPKFDRMKLLI